MRKEYKTVIVILMILLFAIVGVIAVINSTYDYLERLFYQVEPKGCEVSLNYGKEKHVIIGVREQ